MLFKISAEIIRVETEMLCNIVKKRVFIVFIEITENFVGYIALFNACLVVCKPYKQGDKD